MTRTLHLAASLALPLDAVTQTFAFLAVRGAGKSNAAAVMAEEMFRAGLPFVAIDPVGSWWGLRAGGDGKPAGGLAVAIFGGKHGDLPLDKGSGELVADLIVEKRLSCVLDLSQFASEAEKKTFLLAFARRLYQRNQDPLHLFLEEADDYIPQSPQRDEPQLLRAWESIVRRGRARGLGITLITQRSAAIAKMVLTQVETLFALRTTGPQDIKAIAAWVQYHQVDKSLLASLSSLEDGDAWVWSPHYLKRTERIHFRQRETFDSGKTPTNVRGKDARPAATLADVDLEALRVQMAGAIERAEADDPKALRRRIAELERQLAAKPKVAEAKIERVEVPALGAAQAFELERAAKEARETAVILDATANEILSELRRLRTPTATTPASTPRPAPRPTSTATPRPTATTPQPQNGDGKVTAPQQRILDALAWFAAFGIDAPDRVAAACIAGSSSKSSSYTNNLGALRSAGLIEYPAGGGTVALTEAGRKVADIPEMEQTAETLQHAALAAVTGPQARILYALIKAYPRMLDRQALADASGASAGSSSFTNNLGALRTLGFIDYPRSGEVVAAGLLFPEGEARL